MVTATNDKVDRERLKKGKNPGKAQFVFCVEAGGQ